LIIAAPVSFAGDHKRLFLNPRLDIGDRIENAFAQGPCGVSGEVIDGTSRFFMRDVIAGRRGAAPSSVHATICFDCPPEK
jgi:hypothetical protein